MAQYIFPDQTNYGFPLTFEAAGKAPLIAKRIWGTYADALQFANDVSSLGTAVPGLIITVINDVDNKKNGAYRIVKVATAEGANDAVLEKIGGGAGSLTAETYTDALAMAAAEEATLGQLIYVTTTEEIEGTKYLAGAYVVAGVGTGAALQYLTSEAAGASGLTGRVTALETSMGVVQTDINNINKWPASAITTEDVRKIRESQKNVQADWNETDPTKDSYIKNKPEGLAYLTDVENAKAEAMAFASGYTDALSGNVCEAIANVDAKFANYATSADTVAAIETAKTASVVDVVKLDTAESGYCATYEVRQNGTKVGASINIPKDYLVKSASVKVCVEDDKPVVGYRVGDKYIDFVINTLDGVGHEQHVYVLVKDLVDVYTGSTYIHINETNGIELKYDDLKAQLKTDFAIDDLATKAELSAFSGVVKTELAKKVDIEEGKRLMTDEEGTKLEGIAAGAEVNVIEQINVNGVDGTIENKKASVTINATKIELGKDVTDGTEVVSATTKVDAVLQGIYNRLNEIQTSALTEIIADGSGVTIANKNEVKLKLETATTDTIEGGHIEIKVNENGQLYGVMYYIDGDEE